MTLNRRNFIGGMLAVASSPALRANASSAAPDPTPSTRNGPQGWLKRGLVDAGGSHEPYIFVVRRGGQRLDARQTSDFEQSEALIVQLQQAGVEVFHTHLYKGFGMEAELEGMEETRRAVEIAHRHGMKADTYIQWNTLMYETFFVEEPRAVNWIQRNAAGQPILLTYGYQQSYRYRPCFANQDYLDYLKKIVHYAIVEAKTDFIHFDNFDLNAEPDSCHCPACVTGFRARLRRKYSPEQLKQRFGFPRVDYVNPPQWNSDNLPQKMQIIYDPAFQEWIDFRCQLMADALEQMFLYAQSLNPDVAIEINPKGITGENRSWESGIDHARILKFTKAFWSEEEEAIGFQPDGRLVTRVRSYKLARAYSNILLTYIENDPMALAEALAFNQTLGYVGSNPLSQTTRQHIEFYQSNRDSYLDAEDLANVAVLRSYASLSFNNASVQLTTVLAEQTLLEAGIPFDLLFDEGLEQLSKYKLLILPNCECLSDRQLVLLRSYVEQGGALLVIGQTGLYDEWRRARVTSGLAGLVDHQEAGSEYEETVQSKVVKAGTAVRKSVGRGKVGYLSALEFDGELPQHRPYFAITSEFWKRPANWEEMVHMVNWATEGAARLVVNCPRGIAVNYTAQFSRQRVHVHLVNYQQSTSGQKMAIKVTARIPGARKATKVTMRQPEVRSTEPLAFHNENAGTSFEVPALVRYALVTLEW